jgi:hypothetical protein
MICIMRIVSKPSHQTPIPCFWETWNECQREPGDAHSILVVLVVARDSQLSYTKEGDERSERRLIPRCGSPSRQIMNYPDNVASVATTSGDRCDKHLA